MKRTNKEKLALFMLLKSNYEQKGLGTKKAELKAYKTIERLTRCLNFESVKRIYEETERRVEAG